MHQPKLVVSSYLSDFGRTTVLQQCRPSHKKPNIGLMHLTFLYEPRANAHFPMCSLFFRPREHVSLSIVFKVVHGMVACARASDREGPTLFNLKLTRPPGRGLSFVFQSFRLIFSRVKSLVRIDGPSLKPFLGSHGFFFV